MLRKKISHNSRLSPKNMYPKPKFGKCLTTHDCYLLRCTISKPIIVCY